MSEQSFSLKYRGVLPLLNWKSWKTFVGCCMPCVKKGFNRNQPSVVHTGPRKSTGVPLVWNSVFSIIDRFEEGELYRLGPSDTSESAWLWNGLQICTAHIRKGLKSIAGKIRGTPFLLRRDGLLMHQCYGGYWNTGAIIHADRDQIYI